MRRLRGLGAAVAAAGVLALVLAGSALGVARAPRPLVKPSPSLKVGVVRGPRTLATGRAMVRAGVDEARLRAAHPRPSERLGLAREIPGGKYALLHEQRIGHTLWAAYLYRSRLGNHPKICAMTGSVLAPSYFDSSSRCGQLWPGSGTKVPLRAFVRRDSTVNLSAPAPWEGPELFGIFLFSPQVRSVDVRLAGGTSFKRSTRPVPRADLKALALPAIRYATLSVRVDTQIRSVVAFGPDGSELAIGNYPRG